MLLRFIFKLVVIDFFLCIYMDAIYSLSHVTQKYNGRIVLDVDTLQVHRGEVLALVGPSGAGKSTLLRQLAFLELPSSGELLFNGQKVTAQWPDLDTRRQVTMVFQRPQLLQRNVHDNVAYGLNLRGIQKNGEITAVLDKLGLLSLATAKATTLSGGEMQRVALARALVLEPEVLFLDEPTANLDPYNIKLIESLVVEANQNQGTTIVIVTHNVFQARRLATRVGLLLNGRLIEVAPTEAFFESPQAPETAAFLNGDMVY